MENILLVKFSDTRHRAYEVLMWDWKSCVPLDRISSRTGICDFTFLDEAHVAVYSAASDGAASLRYSSLLVYTISTLPSKYEVPPDAHFHASSYSSIEPILQFEFPKVTSRRSISPSGFRFLLRSDPTPGRIIHTSSAIFSCPRTMTLSLTQCLISANIDSESDTDSGVDSSSPALYFRIFVNASDLLGYLGQQTHGAMAKVPWNDWGERSSRWFIDAAEPGDWICWMSASRYVRPRATLRPRRGYLNLSVVNFHTASVNRQSNRASTSRHAAATAYSSFDVDVDSDLVLEGKTLLSPDTAAPAGSMARVERVESDKPTILHVGFEEPVVSRLPYRITTRTLPASWNRGWLIEGEHIVGMTVSSCIFKLM
jgi:hypothetical protein